MPRVAVVIGEHVKQEVKMKFKLDGINLLFGIKAATSPKEDFVNPLPL
jgi:hypothetical protein